MKRRERGRNRRRQKKERKKERSLEIDQKGKGMSEKVRHVSTS